MIFAKFTRRLKAKARVTSASNTQILTPIQASASIDAAALLGVMPSPIECILSENLMKLNHLQQWNHRSVSLTETSLYLACENDSVLRDKVLLDEVTNVFERDRIPGTNLPSSLNGKSSSWKPTINWNSMHELLGDNDSELFGFEVQTVENGFNSGRSYYFRTPTKERRDLWVDLLQEAVENAKMKKAVYEKGHFRYSQSKLQKWYGSDSVQSVVAFLISVNFILNAAQSSISVSPKPSPISDQLFIVNLHNSKTELQPAAGSNTRQVFDGLDVAFTVLFAVELAINLYANWLFPFFSDGWSVFDFLVVTVSLVSLEFDNIPGFSILRLLRAFRVLRLFGKLSSIRQIVNALAAAVVPVCNAFLVLFVVVAIYAVMATVLFGGDDNLRFGSFSRSLFTMFQVCTGDDWTSIARGLFGGSNLSWRVCIFFVTFHLIVSWTILQIVVAVLIENFSTASQKEKDAQRKLKSAREGKNASVTSLDPILASLAHFNTSQDLVNRIKILFKLLDADDSGSLSYEEMAAGLKKLRVEPVINLSKDELFLITDHGALLDANGDLTLKAFEHMMCHQLKLYVQRQLAYAMGVADEGDPSGTLLFVLKMLTVILDDTDGAGGPFSKPRVPIPHDPTEDAALDAMLSAVERLEALVLDCRHQTAASLLSSQAQLLSVQARLLEEPCPPRNSSALFSRPMQHFVRRISNSFGPPAASDTAAAVGLSEVTETEAAAGVQPCGRGELPRNVFSRRHLTAAHEGEGGGLQTWDEVLSVDESDTSSVPSELTTPGRPARRDPARRVCGLEALLEDRLSPVASLCAVGSESSEGGGGDRYDKAGGRGWLGMMRAAAGTPVVPASSVAGRFADTSTGGGGGFSADADGDGLQSGGTVGGRYVASVVGGSLFSGNFSSASLTGCSGSATAGVNEWFRSSRRPQTSSPTADLPTSPPTMPPCQSPAALPSAHSATVELPASTADILRTGISVRCDEGVVISAAPATSETIVGPDPSATGRGSLAPLAEMASQRLAGLFTMSPRFGGGRR